MNVVALPSDWTFLAATAPARDPEVSACVARNGGEAIVVGEHDFVVMFATTTQAYRCAVELEVARRDAPLRIGLHAGPRDSDSLRLVLGVAAHAACGEIVMTAVVRARLSRLLPRFLRARTVDLDGIASAQRLYGLDRAVPRLALAL